MEHRPIIGATKVGTISRKEARGAARFAKTAKKGALGTSKGSRKLGRSSYFKFLFVPATAEPESGPEWKAKRRKKGVKRSAKKSAQRSAKKAASKTSSKRVQTSL
jgi:hypothetical protein